MIADWQIHELIALVRERYPTWTGCEHAAFIADELAPKRDAAAQARELIGKGALRRMLAAGAYDELLARLDRLGHMTNLLWTAQPRRGDLAPLYDDRLQKWAFGEQFRSLLYDQRPSPDRLATFGDFLEESGLPNRWPFPTYFMFLARPHAEMFIKPSVARWYLKFMGQGEVYRSRPSAEMYERYKKNCHGLLAELRKPYGARDMIDVQSLIYVAFAVSQERVGRLDYRGQIELDRPLPLQEEPAPYRLEPAGGEPEQPAGAAEIGDDDQGDAGAQPAAGDRKEPENQDAPPPILPFHSLARIAQESAIDEETLAGWVAAVERKKQAILYGPPGTGKTYIARQIAAHLAGGGDGFVEMVQFHPAYDYADFVEGIRPATAADGSLTYENKEGVFLSFCRRAAGRQGHCVLIIDEINRANLSRVFGELMYLLEYREQTVNLASGREFRIPANVRILGTMNTADRSIALIDHAFRRRFAFIPLRPDFDVLRRWHAAHTGLDVSGLVALLQAVNEAIGDPDVALGISFFLEQELPGLLPAIWRLEIEPYLEELFFHKHGMIDRFRWDTIKSQVDPAQFKTTRPD